VEKFELKIEAVKLKESGLAPLSQTAAGTEASPLYINIDTGFDYSGVITAFIGFLVAIVVGWFTVSVQRNQIQANISNFRHQWMVELRECGSELIQLFIVMTNLMGRNKDYRSGGEYVSHRSRAAQLRAKLDLLLSRDDPRTDDIRNGCGDLLDSINELRVGGDRDSRFEEVARIQDLLRLELESAWEDTKSDLGVNNGIFGIKLFRKR